MGCSHSTPAEKPAAAAQGAPTTADSAPKAAPGGDPAPASDVKSPAVADEEANLGETQHIELAAEEPNDTVATELATVAAAAGKEASKMADDMILPAHESIPKPEAPVLVVILDGYGENKYTDKWNAVHSGNTPCFDKLRSMAPRRYRTIQAHGKAVGLPSDADMGNSEVGHNALGAGQIISQGARLVDNALADGSMFEGDGWKLISEAFESNTVHFIGLLSNGGVHSRTDQLFGCLKGAAERGAKSICCHILTDGRDVPDGSSVQFVEELEETLAELRGKGCNARIASGGGRMNVSMDRYEADWGIVKRGWDAHVLGQASNTFTSAREAIPALKAKSGDPTNLVSDQNLEPFVIVDEEGKAVGTVEDNDAVVLFNFRADRMVELSKAFEYEEFSAFDRVRYPTYDGDLKLPANYLVPPPLITGTSGEYLAKNQVATFACSETQKFGHVTFFWNGNRSGYFDENLETYVEIPSDRCTFDEKPDMKAREITEAGKEALLSRKYQMIRINYANPDMVGHTGNLQATVQAVETCDACLQELLDVADSLGCRWLVTADHGNADDMVQRSKKGEPLMDSDGKALPLTSHTLNPVGVAIGGTGLPDNVVMRDDLPGAGLANVTATYINMLGLQAPGHYQPSLIKTE